MILSKKPVLFVVLLATLFTFNFSSAQSKRKKRKKQNTEAVVKKAPVKKKGKIKERLLGIITLGP